MGALFTEDLVHVLGDGELMVASGKSLDQGTFGNRKLTACKFSRHLPRFSTERMGFVHLQKHIYALWGAYVGSLKWRQPSQL